MINVKFAPDLICWLHPILCIMRFLNAEAPTYFFQFLHHALNMPTSVIHPVSLPCKATLHRSRRELIALD